jgi:integrase
VYRRAIARACRLAFPRPAELTPPELEAWKREHYWHPHQLRHAAATEIRRRFGIEAAQSVLGHSSLKMTELYAEKNADAARAVIGAIG